MQLDSWDQIVFKVFKVQRLQYYGEKDQLTIISFDCYYYGYAISMELDKQMFMTSQYKYFK